MRATLAACALAAGLLAPGLVGAAPPVVPGQVTYQGVLFDDQGQPRTGLVDLTFRIHDAVTGGALVWLQQLSDVPLVDGVFTVQLGPTGSATATPADPLVTDLAQALAGDVPGAAGPRFLEITVGSEGALARTPVLAVPYALRAESAATADLAALATEAQTAQDASSVAGVSADFFAQAVTYGNHDATGPINSDPREGFGDTDGDGILNFVDPDNDDDGIPDGSEVSQGTDLNLPTPVVATVTPSVAPASASTLLTVSGANFDPAQAVRVGFDTPAPQGVTPGSFQVEVGPSIPIATELRVTLPNGETDAAPFTFGSPGAFSNHSINHTAVTNLSFAVSGLSRVAIGGRGEYKVDVSPGGEAGAQSAFPLQTDGSSTTSLQGQIAIARDALDRLIGLRCRTSPVDSGCLVELMIDADGDGDLEDETAVLIESVVTVAATVKRMFAPSLALDPGGRQVAAYVKKDGNVQTAVVAHDRDGDGTFGGAGERVEIETVPLGVNDSKDLGEVAVAPTGEVAYFYWDGSALRLAWDRSGDGDFADTVAGQPELATVGVPAAVPRCLGAAFEPDGVLALVWGVPGGVTTLARDADGSGHIVLAETQTLGGEGKACDVEGGLGLAAFDGETLYVDRNGDGDFDEGDETVSLAPGAGFEHAEIARNAAGQVLVATETRILVDPPPAP